MKKIKIFFNNIKQMSDKVKNPYTGRMVKKGGSAHINFLQRQDEEKAEKKQRVGRPCAEREAKNKKEKTIKIKIKKAPKTIKIKIKKTPPNMPARLSASQKGQLLNRPPPLPPRPLSSTGQLMKRGAKSALDIFTKGVNTDFDTMTKSYIFNQAQHRADADVFFAKRRLANRAVKARAKASHKGAFDLPLRELKHRSKLKTRAKAARAKKVRAGIAKHGLLAPKRTLTHRIN